MRRILEKWLLKSNQFIFICYASFAAFSTYACMYAFRKPFSVATFEGLQFLNIDYKIWLIIAQVLGYTLSKFIGIKIISELKSGKRALIILGFIGFAELSLYLFSIVPMPFNIFFMFLNGLPLGMIWGIVFSYLEGRQVTEVLGSALGVSFIVSSGFVKSVGKIVMIKWGFTEFQMPFVTGLLFSIPLLLFVWMLDQIPQPTIHDKEMRTDRVPMQIKDRRSYFAKFAVGIILLTLNYMFLTSFRDLRDNFVAEIWQALGYIDQPMIFTYTEIPITIVVLIIMASIVLVKNNQHAFLLNHLIILLGVILIGVGTFLYQLHLISPPIWMSLNGLGLYLAYIPFNCILFERFIAVFKIAANAGFLIYIADAFGYLASFGVLLYKNFSSINYSWYQFFIRFSYFISISGICLTLLCYFYFYYKFKNISTLTMES